jgi:uncharacterized surface protein with fasciclin (FAS1) repeats
MRSLKMFSGIVMALGLALTPALAQQTQGEMRPGERGMQRGDIVETARSAGNFNTLVQALEQSGLAQDLKQAGPYTIFAPTDAAFQKLGKRRVDELMKPENKQELANLLKYHVVQGEVTSQDVSGKRTRAETLEGGRLQIDATKGARDIRVNDAKVTGPDIDAQNGIIHPVDKVLQPKG